MVAPPGTAIETGRARSRRDRHLVRGQNGEADSLTGQDLERLLVYRGLGQPHPLRLAAEPPAKIGDTPAHLGDLLAQGAERQDRVVIRHRDRVAVSQSGRAARSASSTAA